MANVQKDIVFLKAVVKLVGIALLMFADVATATQSIGGMASAVTESFSNLASLITAGAYLAGLGFAVGAIMKFKAHKDNPTQVQIGQPIGLLVVGAALLFLPSILGITGQTMFAGSASVAGPKGSAWTGGATGGGGGT